MKPGDIVFFRRRDRVSRIIQLGQWLQYKGRLKPYTYWTHVAIAVDDKSIIEASVHGIRVNTIDAFKDHNFVYDIGASDGDRARVVAFARSCVGETYGWADIITIALSILTNGSVIIGLDGTEICSSLAARALEHANLLLGQDGKPFHNQTCKIKPADLAMLLHVPLDVMRRAIIEPGTTTST